MLVARTTVESSCRSTGSCVTGCTCLRARPTDELVALALASERVQAHLDGAEPRKTIVVAGKLVNLVV